MAFTTGQLVDDIVSYGVFDEVSRASILKMLSRTLNNVWGRNNGAWPFSLVTANTTANSSGVVTLPAAFRKPKKVFDTTNNNLLEYMRKDEFVSRYGTLPLTSSQPYVYNYSVAGGMTIYPLQAVNLTIVYHTGAVDYVTEAEGIQIPDAYSEVLEFGALDRLYANLGDVVMSQYYKSRYEDILSNMTDDLFAQQFDRPDTIQSVQYSDSWWD